MRSLLSVLSAPLAVATQKVPVSPDCPGVTQPINRNNKSFWHVVTTLRNGQLLRSNRYAFTTQPISGRN